MPILMNRNIDVPIDVDLPLSGHLTTREGADEIDDDCPDAMPAGLTTECRTGFAEQGRLPSESATGPCDRQPARTQHWRNWQTGTQYLVALGGLVGVRQFRPGLVSPLGSPDGNRIWASNATPAQQNQSQN